MKKLFAASAIATVLAASTAFAFELPSTQPIRGTEGPDIRLTQDDQSTQPVRGIEGPDIRQIPMPPPPKDIRGEDVR